MLWRNIALAFIFALLLTHPIHGTAVFEDACHKLARGLKLLGAEDIYYQGTYYICAAGLEKDQLIRKMEKAELPGENISAEWYLNRGMDESYLVLQVYGQDYQSCRELADLLTFRLREDNRLLGQNWQIMCYLEDRAGDLALLGRQVVENLGGEIYGIQVYNQTVHFLAYAPWSGDKLMLENGPVNLNMELMFDSSKKAVRLHAGVPVLLTPAHF